LNRPVPLDHPQEVPATPRSRPRPVVLLLTVLTFTAGLVDAVSVLGLGHVFTSLMTGNVVYLGLGLAGRGQEFPLHALLAIASFVGGAWLAAIISRRFLERSLRAWLSRVCLIETCALVLSIAIALAAGEHGQVIEAATPRLLMIAALAFAMGVRTASVAHIPIADMKTTVLTLTLASLAADAGSAGTGMLRRFVSVVTLCLGALAGATLIQHFGVVVALAVMASLVAGSTAAFLATAEARLPAASLAKR